MSKIKLNWITGKRLLERWNLEVRELHLCIQSGLPVYNPNFELEESGPIYTKVPNPDYDPNEILSKKYIIKKNNLHDFKVLLSSSFPVTATGLTRDKILNNLLFKLEDVEQFEKKLSKTIQIEKDTLTPKEAQELGRLRREKSKWDDSIKASLHIGLFCNELSKQDKKITRDMLSQKLFDLKFKDLPNTTIEKIWKAIPEKYRKKAGRPPKNKT